VEGSCFISREKDIQGGNRPWGSIKEERKPEMGKNKLGGQQKFHRETVGGKGLRQSIKIIRDYDGVKNKTEKLEAGGLLRTELLKKRELNPVMWQTSFVA